MAEETLLTEAQTKESEESAQQWDAGNKHAAKKVAPPLMLEAESSASAGAAKGARGLSRAGLVTPRLHAPA